jgi:hypothetical protein
MLWLSESLKKSAKHWLIGYKIYTKNKWEALYHIIKKTHNQ